MKEGKGRRRGDRKKTDIERIWRIIETGKKEREKKNE